MGDMAFQITGVSIKATNAESVSIWWRHHAYDLYG